MNIYFLGIAGAGVSAMASVLASEGCGVSGSDDGVFPPVSTYLDRLGIAYHVGFDAGLVPGDIDAAVIGSSAKLDLAHNPELAEIARRGVPRYSFAQYLGVHTQGRDNVVIAGSFGKSTLTALVAVLMREAGRDPGYFIGAVPLDLPTTGHWGSEPTFLIEGDEYIVSDDDRRPKFALYHPDCALISSLIHDHLNVYPTLASYEDAFAALIAMLAPDALLVCAHGFEALHRLTDGRRVVWYGLEPCEGYHAADIRIGEITRFDLVTPSGARIPLQTVQLGLHNIENIVGAAALLMERGAIDAAPCSAASRRSAASSAASTRRPPSRGSRSTRVSAHPTKRRARRSRRSPCTFPPARRWWCSSPIRSAGAAPHRWPGTTRCSKVSPACFCCHRPSTAPAAMPS
jgi:UDP-N-acetylmuramate: L-alanyl-gamma-D-glutamyl-meso-diaminopimelate ligase